MSKQETIRRAIAEASHKPLGLVTSGARLAEDLGLRSLDRVALAVMLEDRLEVRVPDAKVMSARTVADLEKAVGATAS